MSPLIERTFFIALIGLIFINQGICQRNVGKDSLVAFEFADTAPEPNGGMSAVYKWLAEQGTVTKFDRTDTLDCTSMRNGSVIVMFVVDEQGKLIYPEIGRGIGAPYDTYCLQMVDELPITWKPGTIDGEPVKVRMGLPFNFCAQRNEE